MPDNTAQLNELHDWLNDDSGKYEVHALLKLPGIDWVKIVALTEEDDVLRLTYRGLSLGGYLAGDIDMVCPKSALTAVRRKQAEDNDDGTSMEVADAIAQVMSKGKIKRENA